MKVQCPECLGEGVLYGQWISNYSDNTVMCPVCNGEGYKELGTFNNKRRRNVKPQKQQDDSRSE